MIKYEIVLKHDSGKIKITTVASDIETAKRIVLNYEKAPESAIIKINEKGNI